MLRKLRQKEDETLLPSEIILTDYRPIFFTAQWAFFKSPLGYLVHYCTLHLEPSYNRRARPTRRPGRATNQGYLYLLSCSSHFHYRFLHKMRGSDAKSTAGLMPTQRGQIIFQNKEYTLYNTLLFILFSLIFISFTLCNSRRIVKSFL